MSTSYINFRGSDPKNITSGFFRATLDRNNYKEPVLIATSENITLSGEQTLDNVSLSVGDRVLVKSQTTGSENGIYEVQSGTWTRAKDFVVDMLVSGMQIFVTGGSANKDTLWTCTSASGSDVVGTNNITFSKINPNKEYIMASRQSSNINYSSPGNIALNKNDISNGISLNTGSGVFTLSANKVYVIMSVVHVDNFSSDSGFIKTEWVNSSNSPLTSNGVMTSYPTTSTNQSSNPMTTIIYSTFGGADTNVNLRVVETGTGTANIMSSRTTAIIHEL